MIKAVVHTFKVSDYSTIKKLVPYTTFFVCYATIVIFLLRFFNIDLKIHGTMFQVMGTALGLLLVFRTNTAYDRWWEGRRILGGLTNSCRNFAIKVSTMIPKEDVETRTYFAAYISAFCYVTKDHLRECLSLKNIPVDEKYLNQIGDYKHVPSRISQLIHIKMQELLRHGKINNEQMLTIDRHADIFADVVGACERIKNTPIPYSYNNHLYRFIFIFMMILPFVMEEDMGYWTVPTLALLYFTLGGIKVIGEEIEDPFGTDLNDLPFDKICQNIHKNMYEILLHEEVVIEEDIREIE